VSPRLPHFTKSTAWRARARWRVTRAAQVILASSLGGTGLLTLCALALYMSKREQLEDDTDEVLSGHAASLTPY
jgi:hypothetical protein